MKDWLRKHEVNKEGCEWAINNCSTMQDAWDTAKPEWLIWIATRNGVLTDRELLEFALWSCNRVSHFRRKEYNENTIGYIRRRLDGELIEKEMYAACDVAWGMARGAVKTAAFNAMWNGEFDTNDANELINARCAAHANEVAAEMAAQAKWLRENCRPNFEVKE